MTTTYPSFLLCCRCSTATHADDNKGWTLLQTVRGTSLDICPRCTAVIIALLRQTPDVLEDDDHG